MQFLYRQQKGKQVFRSSVDSLLERKADFSQRHEYVLAESLTRQEKEASACDSCTEPEFSGNFSEPVRYRKFPHMFNVHSWAPVYVNVDNIMNMSFDHVWQAASLGATGIMQNRLSTGVGEFGYSAHKDPYNPSKWRHSGHFKFTYSGLYPVIEASVDFNDRAALQYTPYYYMMGNRASISLVSRPLDTPYVEGRISMYIPWNFSSGGWFRGFIPKVSYRISNDKFNTSLAIYRNT